MASEEGADEVIIEILVGQNALPMRANQSASNVPIVVLIADVLVMAFGNGGAQSAAELLVEPAPELPNFQWQVVQEGEVHEDWLEDNGFDLHLDSVEWGIHVLQRLEARRVQHLGEVGQSIA